MDKYTFLFLINIPFIIFGFLRAYGSYRSGSIKRLGVCLRVLFWSGLFFGLLFSKELYEFLVREQLTDSAPISIADVFEITGIIFIIFLIMRLYARQEQADRRFTKLHQELSILLSTKDKND
jgi:hypothetical protein